MIGCDEGSDAVEPESVSVDPSPEGEVDVGERIRQ
jgi:hypothetical protein